MRALRPEMLRGILGAICVGFFAVYAFTHAGNAEASRAVEQAEAGPLKPTARDLAVFDRRLRKISRDSHFAATCARGQVLGGSEIHFAMNFPTAGQPATADHPAYARAHVSSTAQAPKVLVLEAKYPTLWSVTGAPSAIFVLGESVVADFPEGTPVFAPRYAEGCKTATWLTLPRNWTFPIHQNAINSLVDNVEVRFRDRANGVAKRLFNRPAASWIVQRGDELMTF